MKLTQAAQLVRAIRSSQHRGMTYGDLLALKISTAPWKRLAESGDHFLKDHERLHKAPRKLDGLVVWRIVRATKWTA